MAGWMDHVNSLHGSMGGCHVSMYTYDDQKNLFHVGSNPPEFAPCASNIKATTDNIRKDSSNQPSAFKLQDADEKKFMAIMQYDSGDDKYNCWVFQRGGSEGLLVAVFNKLVAVVYSPNLGARGLAPAFKKAGHDYCEHLKNIKYI